MNKRDQGSYSILSQLPLLPSLLSPLPTPLFHFTSVASSNFFRVLIKTCMVCSHIISQWKVMEMLMGYFFWTAMQWVCLLFICPQYTVGHVSYSRYWTGIMMYMCSLHCSVSSCRGISLKRDKCLVHLKGLSILGSVASFLIVPAQYWVYECGLLSSIYM